MTQRNFNFQNFFWYNYYFYLNDEKNTPNFFHASTVKYLWSTLFSSFWGPSETRRNQKNVFKVVPSIFMKFWSGNYLEELDLLTAQDVYYIGSYHTKQWVERKTVDNFTSINFRGVSSVSSITWTWTYVCIAVHCAEEMVYSEYIVYKSCGELSISKVSKFQKQIILFSILPKNEQKTSILGF